MKMIEDYYWTIFRRLRWSMADLDGSENQGVGVRPLEDWNRGYEPQ